MKPIRFSNIFASALVLSMAAANAGTPAAPAPAAPEPAANWISLTLGGAFVDGDDAAMMARTRTNGDFYGGISDLHYTRDLGNSTTLTLDGHALPGLEDYEFGMLINKEGLGYLKVEYDQFRTWYDASGGYTPLAPSQWTVPFDDERSIDRGELTLEAGLRMENLPEVTFRYTHGFREGQKDSSAWGDPVATGTVYKVVPSLWAIDETVDIFELDIEHTLGKTDLGLGFTYEHSEQANVRYTPRALNGISLNEANESDLFAAHLTSVTRFSDKMWLSFAAAYSTLDSDLGGGYRTYAPYVTQGQRDYSYDSTTGGTNSNQIVTNLNFMWEVLPDLTITPSLRYEHENADTVSGFRAFIPNAIVSTVTWRGNQALVSEGEMDELSEALDIRYKGIENLVLYATGNWAQEDETVRRLDAYMPGEWLNTDIEVIEQEYTVGANWYAMSNLSFSLQGLYELRDQSFDHTAGNQTKGAPYTQDGGANNLRPIMEEHNVEITDLNLRMNWRPMNNLSLVTRYDYCNTEYENKGLSWSPPAAPNVFGAIESGTVESNIVSETVTWNPMARMYVQGSLSWVWSETSTPMSATTPNVDNDYVTCGLTVGYAIDDKTDLTASYNYYGAGNYSMAASSLGYGLETEEHAFSLTLSRMITENMLWNLSYGYITSNTSGVDQSGGLNDYDAHMISTGLQIRF